MQKNFWERKAPTILTCLSSAGVLGTAFLAGRASIKAHEILKNEKMRLDKKEQIERVLPIYIPTICIGAATILCIVSANILNKRSQAALSSAYALLNSSYKDYKAKVKELYGEDAHEKIIESLAVEKAKDVEIYSSFLNTSLQFVEDTGCPVLFYDELSKRYFEATPQQVLLAEYHLNRNFTCGATVSLNDFYDFIGLERTDYGDTVGWTVNDDCIYWIDFHHQKTILDDGLECYILEAMYEPTVEQMDY